LDKILAFVHGIKEFPNRTFEKFWQLILFVIV